MKAPQKLGSKIENIPGRKFPPKGTFSCTLKYEKKSCSCLHIEQIFNTGVMRLSPGTHLKFPSALVCYSKPEVNEKNATQKTQYNLHIVFLFVTVDVLVNVSKPFPLNSTLEKSNNLHVFLRWGALL